MKMSNIDSMSLELELHLINNLIKEILDKTTDHGDDNIELDRELIPLAFYRGELLFARNKLKEMQKIVFDTLQLGKIIEKVEEAENRVKMMGEMATVDDKIPAWGKDIIDDVIDGGLV